MAGGGVQHGLSAAEMRDFVHKTRAQLNAEQAQVYAKLEAVVIQGEGGGGSRMGAGAAAVLKGGRRDGEAKGPRLASYISIIPLTPYINLLLLLDAMKPTMYRLLLPALSKPPFV